MNLLNNPVITLFDYDKDTLSLMSDVLLAAGFPSRIENNRLLSDVAHLEDFTYLDKILKASELGSIDEDKKGFIITVNPPITPEKVARLFTPREIQGGGEEGYMIYEEKWRYFKQGAFLETPVSYIDTHVALLTQALNCADCRTYTSCEGGDFPAHVGFVGPYHHGFGEIIIQETLAKLPIHGGTVLYNFT